MILQNSNTTHQITLTQELTVQLKNTALQKNIVIVRKKMGVQIFLVIERAD